MATNEASVVVVSYEDLLSSSTSPELAAALRTAYDFDGPGILAVRGIPGFVEARAKALPYAFALAHLSDSDKAVLENPESSYAFGWSHGKEMMTKGVPDLLKGSYYNNPVTDCPTEDPALMAAFPSYCAPNVWPAPDVLPGFKDAYVSLARLMVEAGAALATHCDSLCGSTAPTAASTGLSAAAGAVPTLRSIVSDSRCHKARLLYYFPVDSGSGAPAAAAAESGLENVSDHCGWHNDHGSLTALTSAMYFDEAGGEIRCPDARAGLYVRSRKGLTLHVSLPADCCAFQVGETAQIHSGGVLQATPHCVKAPEGGAAAGVSRGTLAVFMQPEWHIAMRAPQGADEAAVLRGARGELLPPGVPPLASRWKPEGTGTGTAGPQTFGEFATATWASYY